MNMGKGQPVEIDSRDPFDFAQGRLLAPPEGWLREWTPDFPVMSEGIDDAAQTPAVILAHGIDLRRSGCHRAGENHIGIGHRQNDADRTAAESLRTEVAMLGGLVSQPKFCAFDGERSE